MPQSWREMDEFEEIDLEDSRVTGWRYEMPPGRLIVTIDARLVPRAGPPSDRPACLVFEEVELADGLYPSAEALESWDDDVPRVDTLARLRREDDGSYHFDAFWGNISVHCASIRLELDDSSERSAA
ncbi:MAG TPA: hypothetical protein VEA99_10695 [Gemmatimonadaceae bacterium]|nr:hypothetical protein [Gemmatimonadaceae bacterium]